MKEFQCYEVFGGIALKNHIFSFFIFITFLRLLTNTSHIKQGVLPVTIYQPTHHASNRGHYLFPPTCQHITLQTGGTTFHRLQIKTSCFKQKALSFFTYQAKHHASNRRHYLSPPTKQNTTLQTGGTIFLRLPTKTSHLKQVNTCKKIPQNVLYVT